ncbi:MAG TPA: CorA family divalent cation transporter [Solirubrobacteraceae bacterium]
MHAADLAPEPEEGDLLARLDGLDVVDLTAAVESATTPELEHALQRLSPGQAGSRERWDAIENELIRRQPPFARVVGVIVKSDSGTRRFLPAGGTAWSAEGGVERPERLSGRRSRRPDPDEVGVSWDSVAEGGSVAVTVYAVDAARFERAHRLAPGGTWFNAASFLRTDRDVWMLGPHVASWWHRGRQHLWCANAREHVVAIAMPDLPGSDPARAPFGMSSFLEPHAVERLANDPVEVLIGAALTDEEKQVRRWIDRLHRLEDGMLEVVASDQPLQAAAYTKELAEAARSGNRVRGHTRQIAGLDDRRWKAVAPRAEELASLVNEQRQHVRAVHDTLSQAIAAEQLQTSHQQALRSGRFQSTVTFLTATLLTPTLVAGVYGANIEELSGEDRPSLTDMVVVMAATALATYTLLRAFEVKPLAGFMRPRWQVTAVVTLGLATAVLGLVCAFGTATTPLLVLQACTLLSAVYGSLWLPSLRDAAPPNAIDTADGDGWTRSALRLRIGRTLEDYRREETVAREPAARERPRSSPRV